MNTTPKCETCNGTGLHVTPDSPMGPAEYNPCPDCNGTGRAEPKPAEASAGVKRFDHMKVSESHTAGYMLECDNGNYVLASDYDAARAEIAGLRKQLEASERDAVRLDWIEKHWFYKASPISVEFSFNEMWDTLGKDLRDAIDKAMKL